MTAAAVSPSYDLKDAVSANRVTGLWRLATGFRLAYLGATLALAIGALGKTATYLLLRYFVDNVLGKTQQLSVLIGVALGFVALALVEGGFTFLSGRLAARTAEGIARRMRNYLYDHIQRLTFSYHDHMQTGELIQRSTSDVDAVRRFYADQALGIGRIILLFGINYRRGAAAERAAGAAFDHRRPVGRGHLILLLQAGVEGVREVPGTGGHPVDRAPGEPVRRAGGEGVRPPGLRAGQVRA